MLPFCSNLLGVAKGPMNKIAESYYSVFVSYQNDVQMTTHKHLQYMN